jgi:predicted transglutaminase-like cysteine proteinase
VTPDPSRPAVPDIIKVFGQSAAKAPRASDPQLANWEAMLQRQKEGLADTAKAEAYAKYLARFNGFKDWSLHAKAFAVNHTVVHEVAYTPDPEQYNEADYWASPIETALNKKGDCEDFALLQHAILRHLGVPENKMFIVLVNQSGKADVGPNHAVVMIDMAEEGQSPEYYILNDIRPLLIADNAAIEKIWRAPGGEKASYVLFDARNMEGFWTTGFKYEATVPAPKNGTKPSGSVPK